MARYIDAEELCRRLNECWETNDIDKGRLIQQVIDRVITPIVVGTPTADVVEVVRCKDCKYSRPRNESEKHIYFGGVFICESCEMADEPCAVCYDDFCSYGERRTENDR